MPVVFAFVPLLIAFVLLLVFRWNGRDVGWVTFCSVIVLVSLVPTFYQTPGQIAVSLGEGMATMVTIGSILLPALLYYHMQQESGAIAILMDGLAQLVPDSDLQTLLLVLGVGPCIECVCGSGSGAVAILPFLVRLHTDKLKSVQLCLLSQIIVAWGSLGQGTVLAANLAALPVAMLSTFTALLLLPSALGFSIFALYLSGGKKALGRYWCLGPLAGSLLMLATCLCSRFLITEVAGVLASICVMVLLLVWSQCMSSSPSLSLAAPRLRQLVSALLPPFLLMIGIFVTRLLPPVQNWLQTFGVVSYPPIQLHLAVFYSPGLWLLLAALVHVPLFSLKKTHVKSIQVKTWRRFFPAAVAMLGFLSTAALMQESGMIDVLGSAAAALGPRYAWIASLLGALGGWLTNTILGGNALMVPMQRAVATSTGLPLPWLIATQNASAALGSAISPARLLLIATAVGLLGKEALLFRKMGPIILWSLVLTTLLFLWFTFSSWLVLLALLVIVNAPIIMTPVWPSGKALKQVQHVITAAGSALPVSSHQPGLQPWLVRVFAFGGLLLVNVLFASFSLVSFGPLHRIDPVIFLCFQMMLLVPIAIVFLLQAAFRLDRALLRRGMLLGGFLSIGLLFYTLSLKDTGITETMIFSTVNGVIAAGIGWKVFGQRLSRLTGWACVLALGGAGLVWSVAPMQWQGDVTALVGGVFLTTYSFQVEQLLKEIYDKKAIVQPVIGVQLLTMALITLVLALCFGRWQTVCLLKLSDLVSLIYLSLGTIVLPCFILLVTQRYISAVTVSFLSVIEPLAAIGFAVICAGERLPALVYIGGGIVLLGIMLQVVAGGIKPPFLPSSSSFVVPFESSCNEDVLLQ